MDPDTSTGAQVARLQSLLRDLTTYSQDTGRLGLHDLPLYETLREQAARGQMNVSAEDAMVTFLDTGATVFVGGPKGYGIWEQFDDEALDESVRLGLIVMCERHGGPWGGDETCPRCTHPDGTTRAQDDPGPLLGEHAPEDEDDDL